MRLQAKTESWFEVPEDPDKTEFKIKHLRSGEINKAIDASYTQGFKFQNTDELDENGDRKLEPVPVLEISKTREKESIIQQCIVDWKNVFNADGTLIDCTEKNKQRLCDELSDEDFAAFARFIKKCRTVLADQIKAQEEERTGN